MVCHLEYRSQYCPFIHPRVIYLDTLARDLLASTKTGLVKLLATADMELRGRSKVLVIQIWNAVIDHVQQLPYHQVASETDS